MMVYSYVQNVNSCNCSDFYSIGFTEKMEIEKYVFGVFEILGWNV